MKKTLITALALVFTASVFSENVIQVKPFVTSAGVSAFTPMEVYMVNDMDITAMNFDIYLPQGFTLRTAAGKSVVPSDRFPMVYDDDEEEYVTTHQCSVSVKDSDPIEGMVHYFFTCYDEDFAMFRGKEGKLFDLLFKTDNTITPGVYPIIVKGAVLAQSGSIGVRPATSVSYVVVGEPQKNVLYNLGEELLVPSFVRSSLAEQSNIIVNGECENFVLEEGADLLIPCEFTAKNASYTRQLDTEGWYSIVLPFAADVPGDVVLNRFGEINDEHTEVTLSEVSVFEAHHPYIFYGGGNVNFSATDVAVAPQTSDLADGYWTGTYAQIPHGGITGYYALCADGQAFGRCTENAYVEPFHAYLKVQSSANSIRIVNRGTVNISTPMTDNNSSASMYDLWGRKVLKKNGIIISEGNKYLK